MAVFEHLYRAEPHHPTAEELYQSVKSEVPSLSLATVYKALDALESCGLVSKLPDADGSARYDARSERHYHLRCLRSGQVRDLPTTYDPDLIARLDPDLSQKLKDQGFQVTGYRLELVGYFEDQPPRQPDPSEPE